MIPKMGSLNKKRMQSDLATPLELAAMDAEVIPRDSTVECWEWNQELLVRSGHRLLLGIINRLGA